jgi:uncharacterized protein
MLTEDLIRPFLRFTGQILTVDHLDEGQPFWLQTAKDLIALYHESMGQSRIAWERKLEVYLGNRVDYLRVRGLARILAPASAFTPINTPLSPIELRSLILPHGPVFASPDIFHPTTRHDLLQEVGKETGLPPEQVEVALFTDRPEEHRLTRTAPFLCPEHLLARYNLELARGALYRSTGVQIEIYDNFKEVFRYLKLFRIMYWAVEIPTGGYRLTLFGPLSDFIDTDRYGIAFAEFMPALVLGERWSLVAKIKTNWNQPSHKRGVSSEYAGSREDIQQHYIYRLNQTCGLSSHYKHGPHYDSLLEKNFAEEFTEFEEKFGAERGRWRLKRESQIIVLEGGVVMIPDFVLESILDERRKIMIEIVGFWEPGYIKRKLLKARTANNPLLLFLVFEDLNVSKEDFDGLDSATIFFKRKPIIKEIMPVVENMAERAYGPLPLQKRGMRATAQLPFEQLVQSCYEQVGQREKQGWLLLGQLEEMLKHLDPSFTPRHYGFGSLSTLIQEHPTLFATRRRSAKGRPIEVCLLWDGNEEQAGQAGAKSLTEVQAHASPS